MPTLGRSPAIARSDLKRSDANDHDACPENDVVPPLGSSPAIASSDLERVGPIDHKTCPICQETVCQGESDTITLPCCPKMIHKHCMWEIIKNEPGKPKCPLCRAIYDLDDQANLIAMTTIPMNTSTLSTFYDSIEVVALTTCSLSKRLCSLGIEEVYAELDRLLIRQMSKKARNGLKCRLYKRMQIIE